MKWLDKREEYDSNVFECSKCGFALQLIDGTPEENNYHFCPRCGKKDNNEKTESQNNIFNQKIFDYFIEEYNIALLQDEMLQIKNLCYGCWIDDLKNQESETLCFWFGGLVSELEKRDLLPPQKK